MAGTNSFTKNYSRGTATNIVVGAAAIFTNETANTDLPAIPAEVDPGTGTYANGTGYSYVETLSQENSGWTNVGYTANGLELTFQPAFGEVKVDQILDVAKLYKQGMKVELKTTFAEATLQNLLVATAATKPIGTDTVTGGDSLELLSGELGEYPIERSLIAVGASVQADASTVERIYQAHRVLSIQNVTVAAKRDTATEFEVTFRLLPNNDGSYGKIVDRTYTKTA